LRPNIYEQCCIILLYTVFELITAAGNVINDWIILTHKLSVGYASVSSLLVSVLGLADEILILELLLLLTLVFLIILLSVALRMLFPLMGLVYDSE
jgi:hypothetical protein